MKIFFFLYFICNNYKYRSPPINFRKFLKKYFFFAEAKQATSLNRFHPLITWIKSAEVSVDKLNLFFLLSFFLDLNHSARCDKTLVFLEQLLDKPQISVRF